MANRLILSGTQTAISSGGGATQPHIADVTDVVASAPVPILVDGAIKASITITYKSPAVLGTGDEEFAGVQSFLSTPLHIYDQGWQRPASTIVAATNYSFDIIVPYPAAAESWTIYLASRSEIFVNTVKLDGVDVTPNVVVAMAPFSGAAPNVRIFSAGKSNGDGTFSPVMYWDNSNNVNMLIDWACLAPAITDNFGGVQIWVKIPDGIGGFNYVAASGVIPLEAFAPSIDGPLHYDTISSEPANIPEPPQSWDFIAVSFTLDGIMNVNGLGKPTGPTVTLTTLTKSDLVIGFTAFVRYGDSEAGDQVFNLGGSWTNPAVPRNKGTRIVLRGYSPEDQILAEEKDGSTQFFTRSFPVPDSPKAVSIYAVPIYGNNTVAAITGLTPVVTLTIQRQTGSTGIEFAPLITSFACSTPYYGIDANGQQLLYIDVTWVKPASVKFGGIILKMIRAAVHYTLSGIEPDSPNRIEISNFPTANEAVTVYALSVDTNNRANSYLFGGTPAVALTLPPPIRVGAGSAFSVAYAYQKLKADGQIALILTPTFTVPTGANFGWFDWFAFADDSLWYQLGSPMVGGAQDRAIVERLPAVAFTWIFRLIPKDVNNKDRDGNTLSNPATPPTGALTFSLLINPPTTDVPLGQVSVFSVQAKYTNPDSNGSRSLLVNPIFTKPADFTWAYIDFWARPGDFVWRLLGSPSAGSQFVGLIPGPGVATITDLPTAAATWLFAAVSRNVNNQDVVGNYDIPTPGNWPAGTPTTSLLISPPPLGVSGLEYTSNVSFDLVFNSGVNPSTSFSARADGTTQYQVFAKLVLPVGDPTWAGFDVVTISEDSAGVLDLTGAQVIRLTGIKTVDAIFLLNIPTSIVRLAVFFVSFDSSGRRNSINATEMAISGGTLTPRKDVTVGSLTGLADLSKALTTTLGPAMAILSGKLDVAPLGIDTSKLGALSVDNSKLAALAVDAAKLANSAVTSTKIANLAVGTAAIAFLAVGTSQIQNLGVQDGNIANLQASKLTAGTLIAGIIYTGVINTNQLNAGTISVAITLTSPTILVSGGGGSFTVNINSIDAVKSSTGSVYSQLYGPIIQIVDGTTQVFSVTSTGGPSAIATFRGSSGNFALQVGSSGVDSICIWYSNASEKVQINSFSGLSIAGVTVLDLSRNGFFANLRASGQLQLGGSISAGSPAAAATHKIAVYNNGGTFLNYLYLYP